MFGARCVSVTAFSAMPFLPGSVERFGLCCVSVCWSSAIVALIKRLNDCVGGSVPAVYPVAAQTRPVLP